MLILVLSWVICTGNNLQEVFDKKQATLPPSHCLFDKRFSPWCLSISGLSLLPAHSRDCKLPWTNTLQRLSSGGLCIQPLHQLEQVSSLLVKVVDLSAHVLTTVLDIISLNYYPLLASELGHLWAALILEGDEWKTHSSSISSFGEWCSAQFIFVVSWIVKVQTT